MDTVLPSLFPNDWLVGRGKTILAYCYFCCETKIRSSIITAICSRRMKDARILLAYFFCNGTVLEKQTPRYVIGSILNQFLSQLSPEERSAQMVRVASIYDSDVYKGNNYQVRDLDQTLVRILEDIMINLPDPFYVVIDGLDEVESSTRSQLLDFLKCLRQSTAFNLLLTSRPETDVRQAFSGEDGGIPELPISESAVHQDIYSYVKWQLENDPDLCRIRSESLKLDIESTLLERSGGM